MITSNIHKYYIIFGTVDVGIRNIRLPIADKNSIILVLKRLHCY